MGEEPSGINRIYRLYREEGLTVSGRPDARPSGRAPRSWSRRDPMHAGCWISSMTSSGTTSASGCLTVLASLRHRGITELEARLASAGGQTSGRRRPPSGLTGRRIAPRDRILLPKGWSDCFGLFSGREPAPSADTRRQRSVDTVLTLERNARYSQHVVQLSCCII